MDPVSINILLEYLYKRYIVTFLLCLVGAFIKESTMSTAKVKKISILKILSPSIFSSVLICALSDYMKVPFGVYTGICIVTGMWGSSLVKLFLNIKFIKYLVTTGLAKLGGTLGRKLSDMSEEYFREQEKNKTKKSKKSKQDQNQGAETVEEIEDNSLK